MRLLHFEVWLFSDISGAKLLKTSYRPVVYKPKFPHARHYPPPHGGIPYIKTLSTCNSLTRL